MAEAVLQRLLALQGPDIDREIKRCLAGGEVSTEFSAMMGYQLGFVDEQLLPTEESVGKRFRPLLCLLACEGAGGTAPKALSVAAAIEILHNFSLVHDDIEDRDATRRHRPTVWKIFGEAQGINVGDGMFAVAGQAILEHASDQVTVLDVARHFWDTARALTEGQFLDMSFEHRTDVGPEQYSSMVAHKTGSLIAFSLWAGGRLAHADAATLHALSAFGHELGQSFQIHDDIAGIWASEDRTGKERGRDLHNRKKTLPILLAAERAVEPHRTVLRHYLQGRPGDVATVMEALDDSDARAHAEERVAHHLHQAGEALEQARLTPEVASTLVGLAAELAGQAPLTS